jgi:hypothetical protein
LLHQEFVLAVTQIALDSIPQARTTTVAEGFYLRNKTSISNHMQVPYTNNFNIVHSDKGWWFISLLMFIMNKRKEFGKSLV